MALRDLGERRRKGRERVGGRVERVGEREVRKGAGCNGEVK
jgi:hypothetical protein